MDTVTEDLTEYQSVKVTRVVPRSLKDVWDALMQPQGAEALLGEGGRLANKGEDWRAADGTYGVTRSFHPLEQIRFSWHESEGAPRTLVDLHLREADEGSTELELVHEHLPADANTDALTRRWEEVLERIENDAV